MSSCVSRPPTIWQAGKHWTRHHDGLRCLTSALCHVYGADPTRHHGHYQFEETRSGGALPPSRAFMDDVNTLARSKVGTQELLDCFHDLFSWTRMKAKPKKSRSISLVHGTICDIHFFMDSNIIQTVREHRQTTQRSRGTEDCPGGPSRHWEECASLKASRLKLSNSTSTSTSASGWVSYTATGMLQLPLSSITKEFKVGKARLHIMLRDSPDDVIRQVQPEVRTGTKWSAAKAVQETDASLHIKEVIGATQTGRAGLRSTLHW